METLKKLFRPFSVVPLAGWLLGVFCAVVMEYYLGDLISYYLYLPKIPVLFGALFMLKTPLMIPSALAYDLIVYIVPVFLVARLTAPLTNQLAAQLERMPLWLATVLHLAAFYAILIDVGGHQ